MIEEGMQGNKTNPTKRGDVESERKVVTTEILRSEGYKSVDDMLKSEMRDRHGVVFGFFDGVNGSDTINLGLNERGRKSLRNSARIAIRRHFSDPTLGGNGFS